MSRVSPSPLHTEHFIWSLNAILWCRWVSCTLTKLWHYLEKMSDPTGWGLSPTKPLLLHFSQKCKWWVPRFTQLLSDLLTDRRSPQPPPYVTNLAEQLAELREILMVIHQFIEGHDKGCRWAALWRATQGEVWGGSESKNFSHVALGCATLPVRTRLPAWKMSEPCTMGIFLILAWSTINFLSSLSLEDGVGLNIPSC